LKTFVPRLEILAVAQRTLWPELKAIPARFVLYGGTGVALRLGHRASVDFDFFTSEPFMVQQLLEEIRFLQKARPLQAKNNTFTAVVEFNGPVKLSFFGGLSLGRVGQPELTNDQVLWVASSLDLAATKAAVISQRAEQKDYLDMAALLGSGLGLEETLGAARALYGERFNPMISLKALTYFADGDLTHLPQQVQQRLTEAASKVVSIPELERISEKIAGVN
jgi:hypothetical protein